jgi:hypothetical protein
MTNVLFNYTTDGMEASFMQESKKFEQWVSLSISIFESFCLPFKLFSKGGIL